jgi:subtilase family serine protease
MKFPVIIAGLVTGVVLSVRPASALVVSSSLAAGVPAPVHGLRDLGAARVSDRVHLAIMLNYHHQPELDALVDAQGTPGTRLYRRFLTSSQFDDYFAPTTQDYARVLSSLRQAGFAITRAYRNRTVVDADAPASVAERYFSTQIHRVYQPGYGVRHENVTPAYLPTGISGLVSGVVGLSDLIVMHTFNHRGTPHHGAVNPGPLFGPDTGYGPQAFIDAYDLPANRGYLGTGRTAGIVIDASFSQTDYTSFLQYFRIPAYASIPIVVNIDGGPPAGLTTDSVEATLDVEAISGIAPLATIDVYAVPTLADSYVVDAYAVAVAENQVETLNSSFGGCEALQTSANKVFEQIALQGSALGITFHAASGDAGYIAFGCEAASVDSPASLPHFVSVGGTQLNINPRSGAVTSESAWSDASGASGGGISTIFPLPAYQTHIAHVLPGGRNVPDIAFDASPGTGMSLYYNGAFAGPIGGTSLASPIFGAMLVEANQLDGSRAGYVNPRIYAGFRTEGYSSKTHSWYFRNAVGGFDGLYYATPGYNLLTGIGAANGTNFAKVLK